MLIFPVAVRLSDKCEVAMSVNSRKHRSDSNCDLNTEADPRNHLDNMATSGVARVTAVPVTHGANLV